MFKDFLWTPLVAGLEDGINPCLLITFAVLLLGMLWLKRAGISRIWVAFVVLVMMLSSFAFNCGFLEKIILNNYFQIAARLVYLIIATIVGLKGLKFFKQWFLMIKGKEVAPDAPVKIKVSPVVLVVVLFAIGFLLSMLSILWPINSYITMFSVYMLLPGNLVTLGSLVLFYTIVSYWFVLIAVPVSLLEASNPRLFKIVAAAFLLTASIGSIDIIFMKG